MANGENLHRQIALLQRTLREAAEETDRAERALDDLARQEPRSVAATPLEARLLEAVGARDSAANRAAEAIAQLIASFERLDAARAATDERVAETKSQLRRRAGIGPEPARLEREWARLIDFIRTRAQLHLDEELVEAAASSPAGYDIDKLPQHLQLLARRRRTKRMRAASREARNKFDS